MAVAGALGGLLLTTGCHEQPPAASPALPAQVVAVVGTQAITVASFQSNLARRSRSSSGNSIASNEVRAWLEDMIRSEVLYIQARQTGFMERPEIQAAVKRLVVAQYRESLATNGVSPARVSETDIERYYRAQTNLYQVPEQVRAALLFLPLSSKATPEKQAEARARAEALRAQALVAGEAGFALLVQTNSAHQPTRYRGGDLGWLSREAASREWEPAMVSALFELQQTGQISPTIEGKAGLYLVRLTARQPASLRPLAEVKDSIAYQLARQQEARREETLYAQLKAGVPVRINEAALTSFLTNAVPTQTPPAVPE